MILLGDEGVAGGRGRTQGRRAGHHPKVTTGILHNSDGSGQVGAGVAEAPIEVFVQTLLALDAKLSDEA